MARPQPTIILTTDVDEFFAVDILAAPKLYAVVYQGQHINIKTRYWQAQGELKKYLRTAYPNKKSATNLAQRLNKYFMCNDFTVKEIL